MNKEKIKKYQIAITLSLCMAYLLTACQCKPNGVRPFDYPPAKWVSESGELWFTYTGNEKEKNSSGWPFLEGGYKKGEESFQCCVEFTQYYGISIYNAENKERVLSGICKFGKEELVVKVRQGKKYKEKEKITFIRYPLETESETEENAKTE